MKFRTATLKDITEISETRKKQIQDEGQTPDIDIDEDLHRYFEKYMKSGELIEWVAEEDGRIIATAAIVFIIKQQRKPPLLKRRDESAAAA